jgi:hypothetical protein
MGYWCTARRGGCGRRVAYRQTALLYEFWSSRDLQVLRPGGCDLATRLLSFALDGGEKRYAVYVSHDYTFHL